MGIFTTTNMGIYVLHYLYHINSNHCLPPESDLNTKLSQILILT